MDAARWSASPLLEYGGAEQGIDEGDLPALNSPTMTRRKMSPSCRIDAVSVARSSSVAGNRAKELPEVAQQLAHPGELTFGSGCEDAGSCEGHVR